MSLYTNISALKNELVMVVGFQSATRCSGQGRYLQSQFTCLQLIKNNWNYCTFQAVKKVMDDQLHFK